MARKRKKPKRGGLSPAIRWTAAAFFLVLVCLLGMLAWSRTPPGRAALLRFGANKFFGQVQTEIGRAASLVVPGLRTGPAGIISAGQAEAAIDFDWPCSWVQPAAAIRCRLIPIPDEWSFWELQERIAGAIDPVGGRVLWGERIQRSRRHEHRDAPNEQADLLRIDLGVEGVPTHTLVFYRPASGSTYLHWGSSAAATAWSHLVGAPAQPTVALVIDDWGYYQNEVTQQMLSLPCPLTLSILPDLPFSRRFALEATDLALPPTLDDSAGEGAENDRTRRRRLTAGCPVEFRLGKSVPRLPTRRREVMLHLPMEPEGYPEVDPGSGAILVGMDRDEIEARIDEALTALPRVSGVNNHMGSRATADRSTMDRIMAVLADRGLFFLDSMTTAHTVAKAAAAHRGIRFVENRIFLDQPETDPDQVRALLRQLVRSAQATGFAIGIGHPNEALVQVLRQEIPRLQAEAVRFVTVSELIALQQVARAGTRSVPDS